LNAKDALCVFSVGGGNVERGVSVNLGRALEVAKSVGARICGVVGRDGGYTATVADACVLVPTIRPETVTVQVLNAQGRIVNTSPGADRLVPMLSPSSIERTYASYLGFAAGGLSILLPVVSILTLTSEWSQRTVLTTFTQEPRRIRVINAKVAVSLLLAAAGAVFGALVTLAGLGVAAASGRELDANLNAGVLFFFAVGSVVELSVFMAGWSSRRPGLGGIGPGRSRRNL